MKTDDNTSNLIEAITTEVERYFLNPLFDPSHDFIHVRRVHNLAKQILQAEREIRPNEKLDGTLVVLGALLHDVGDYKYQTTPGGADQVTATTLLLKCGASAALAETVQRIVDNVSYSHEIRDTGAVAKVIEEIPELAIVQDADRIDAIGAIGIGRLFTFGGARRRDLADSMAHADVKLVKLERMMKTQTGSRLAAERTERLREFMGWWKEEWGVLDEE